MSYYLFLYITCDISCAIFAIILLQKVTLNLGDIFEVQWLRRLIRFFIFFALTDMVWPAIRLQLTMLPVTLLKFLCSLSEIALGAVAYAWFVFAQYRLRPNIFKKTKNFVLLTIPFVVLCLIALASIATGWLYTINPDGSYSRGPLFAVQHIIIYSYIFIVAIQAIINSKNAKTDSDKRLCRSTISFGLFPFIASLIQIYIPMTTILTLSIFAAILFIFIDFMEGQIFTDALTGLNNRRQAERYFSNLVAQVNKSNTFFLYMLDVDSFKGINDSHGHVEGDAALRLVALCLKKIASRFRGFAARYGGDEFVLIIQASNIMDPKIIPRELNSLLIEAYREGRTPYQLTLSGGWYQCVFKDETFEDVVSRADSMLYVDKRGTKTTARS